MAVVTNPNPNPNPNQSTTALCSAAVVKGFGLSVENGHKVGLKN